MEVTSYLAQQVSCYQQWSSDKPVAPLLCGRRAPFPQSSASPSVPRASCTRLYQTSAPPVPGISKELSSPLENFLILCLDTFFKSRQRPDSPGNLWG